MTPDDLVELREIFGPLARDVDSVPEPAMPRVQALLEQLKAAA
jgi:hypothetical protein